MESGRKRFYGQGSVPVVLGYLCTLHNCNHIVLLRPCFHGSNPLVPNLDIMCHCQNVLHHRRLVN